MSRQTLPLKYFKDLVQERSGLSFDKTRESILRQKVSEVMSQKGYRSRAELYDVITKKDKEFLDFVNHLTINETFFFREPQYLKQMTDHLVPELLKKRGDEGKLKIISAGCSTGEEPYSIAMALLEKYGNTVQNKFSIIGIDINSVALNKAADGLYGKLSFREDISQFKKKYFDKGKYNLFKIKSSVKKLVTFKRVNLLDNTFSKELHNADIIFYRNVSIYFDSATQQKIISQLASIMRDDAYVVFAASETFSHKDNALLALIEHQGLFCYQKRKAQQENSVSVGDSIQIKKYKVKAKKPVTSRQSPKRIKVDRKLIQLPQKAFAKRKENIQDQKNKDKDFSPDVMFANAVNFFRKKENAQALVIAEELKNHEGYVGKAHLLEGCILLNAKKYEEAEAALNKAVQKDELDLDAYMMLGLVAKNSGKIMKAIECFKKALYVQYSCWIAHYYLGEIFQAQGEKTKAERYYDSVLEILENGSMESGNSTFFPISFQRHDFMHLCRKKIESLRA